MIVKILTTSVFLCSLLNSFSQEKNLLRLDWDSNGYRYLLHIGTNSGSYQSQHSFTNTFAWLGPDAFQYGTNYVSVSEQAINDDGSLALISDPSEEVLVIKKRGLPVRLHVGVLSSTNLIDWNQKTNFVISINANETSEFFKPSIEILQKEADILESFPPSP